MNYCVSLISIILFNLTQCSVDKSPKIQIFSPRSDTIQPAGQDLILKFQISGYHKPCSVVAVLNGKMNRVIPSCQSSFAIDEDELEIGPNEIELLLQADIETSTGDDAEPPSASVAFNVELRPPWYTPEQLTCAGPEAEGRCSQCLHSVNDTCIVRRAPTSHAIPSILHWVWVGGGGPIPARFDRFMASWRALHPDWQFVVWTDPLVTWPLRNAALLLQADSYAGLRPAARERCALDRGV